MIIETEYLTIFTFLDNLHTMKCENELHYFHDGYKNVQNVYGKIKISDGKVKNSYVEWEENLHFTFYN